MSQCIGVIGGDARQIEAARVLRECGYQVFLAGLDRDLNLAEDIPITEDLETSLKNADMVLLPIPVSFDDEHIHTPLYAKEISMRDLFSCLPKDCKIFGGMMTPHLKKLCQEQNFSCWDYFNREEMKIANAVPTAEGAIEIAMREMPITLHESRALVLGYGRIGKILSRMLSGMGAYVTACARRCSDLSWIEAAGHRPERTENVGDIIGEYDVIFNTIPAPVLDAETLTHVRRDSLIIDLASKPGGVDFDAAKAQNKKVIWALSLPGKVAPITAGRVIAKTMMNMIKELGV